MKLLDPRDQSWVGALTLDGYIEKLLRLGKRSSSTEFQELMSAFGADKITHKAKHILKSIAQKDREPGDDDDS